MKILKKSLAIMLIIALVFGMAACGGGGGEEENGELNIFMWSDYMSEQIVEDFEAEYGVTVNIAYMSNSEEATAKITSGGGDEYDLVMPCDADMETLIQGGYLAEIDTANMENFQYIDDAYKNRSFDPENKWAIPYLMNYIYVVVNEDTCPIEITTYEDLKDPALKGKLSSVTGIRNLFPIALIALGYDPNSKEESEIAEAYEWLKGYMANVNYLNSDDAEAPLVAGSVVAGYIFDGMAGRAFMESEGQNLKVAELTDPIQLGVDEFVIPAEAKNKENAELFLNYIMDPEVMAKNLSDDNPYMCPNSAAVELMDDEYKTNPAIDFSPEMKENYFLQLDVGDAMKIYDKYWTMLLSEEQ